MKSLLDFLGLGRGDSTADHQADTATVRKIVRQLDALEPQQARFIAAFAYILGRVANADLDISEQESLEMEQIVSGLGGLPEEQAVMVVEIAKAQNRLMGGTENYQVTRQFANLADREQREQLLDCLFAVGAADGSISGVEEAQIRMISEELGFSDNDFRRLRSGYSDQRSVMQRMRRRK